MKRWLLAAACGVVALGLLLYPLVGELLNEKYHSDVETTYTAVIADTDDAELTVQREAAEQYNAMLSGAATITEGGASAPPLAYSDQLTVGGVMVYIDIPKINVYLPVQHGTDADTLENSVGHVVGTSLPVGGSSSHAVLSAHSGMARSKLFSDIDQLAEGDTFYIHVLGEVLAYKVDTINTVLPTDTSLLQIEDGKDQVTLLRAQYELLDLPVMFQFYYQEGEDSFGESSYLELVMGDDGQLKQLALRSLPVVTAAESYPLPERSWEEWLRLWVANVWWPSSVAQDYEITGDPLYGDYTRYATEETLTAILPCWVGNEKGCLVPGWFTECRCTVLKDGSTCGYSDAYMDALTLTRIF